MELLELQRRLALAVPLLACADIKPDDLGAELGELTRDVLTDTRRTPGDDDPAAVVAPQLVNLSHRLRPVGRRVPCWSTLLLT